MSKPRIPKQTREALYNLGFRIGDCSLKLNLIRAPVQGAHETIFEAMDAPDSRLGDKNYANPAWGAACSLMALGDAVQTELRKLDEMMDDLQGLQQAGGTGAEDAIADFEQKYQTKRTR